MSGSGIKDLFRVADRLMDVIINLRSNATSDSGMGIRLEIPCFNAGQPLFSLSTVENITGQKISRELTPHLSVNLIFNPDCTPLCIEFYNKIRWDVRDYFLQDGVIDWGIFIGYHKAFPAETTAIIRNLIPTEIQLELKTKDPHMSHDDNAGSITIFITFRSY